MNRQAYQRSRKPEIVFSEQLCWKDPNNEGAQSDLAQAYEKSGRDPLDVYRNRFENNPSNISYGLDYADKLSSADRFRDAVNVLREVADLDPSSKSLNTAIWSSKRF